jgi:2-hydroxy-3-keto-5-methylthiopentenyl-1-phosphate phosphatase
MLIICDFDGTVTARDTNYALAQRFAPNASAQVAGRLASRELTLREVLATEFEEMTVGLDAIVDAALEIPFREGFTDMLDEAERTGARVMLLSSGFHEIIEPMLARQGLDGRVPLVANRIQLDADGGRITWRDLPECELCGEPCKRHDVGALRDQFAGAGETVVFVGDGFSDRCGAETADRIFARDSLAQYLDGEGVGYERWNDFHDIIGALGLDVRPGDEVAG